MSYYNPDYYNINLLKKQDRNEIEFWVGECDNAVDNAVDDVVYEYGSGKGAVAEMAREIAEKTARAVKENIRGNALELMVSIIDDYTDEEYAELEAKAEPVTSENPYGSIFNLPDEEDDEE